MKLSKYSDILSSMFKDSVDVFRYTNVIEDDGTTTTVLPTVATYSAIPCRLSYSAKAVPNSFGIDSVPVSTAPTLYVKIDADIQVGDRLQVKRFNDDGSTLILLEGRAGLASVFPTHKELLFLIEESA